MTAAADGAGAKGAPPGGDGSPYPGLRHLGSGVMANLARSAETMRETAAEMSEAAHRTRDSAARAAEGATTSASNLGAVSAAAEQMSVQHQRDQPAGGRATHAAPRQWSVPRHRCQGGRHGCGRGSRRRRGAADHRYRRPHQSAGAERHDRGGARRRCRQGFAVVAGEVKALATQTAKATEEIAAQITAIRAATGEAVTAVRDSRRGDRRGERGGDRDCRRGGGTGRGDARNRRQRPSVTPRRRMPPDRCRRSRWSPRAPIPQAARCWQAPITLPRRRDDAR